MLNQMPGTGSIADSVEFVKKMWGLPSAGALPGMLIPTLSLEDVNKKISDLKTVASWLQVNMNMLQGTIQALEVQSATIANLQAMSAVMGAKQADSATTAPSAAASPFAFPIWPSADSAMAAAAAAPLSEEAATAPNPHAWWDILQNQFKQAVGTALTPEAAATAPSASAVKSARPAAKPKAAPTKAATTKAKKA